MLMSDSDQCPSCGEVETSTHLLLTCQTTNNTWFNLNRALNIQTQPTVDSILGSKDKTPLIKIKAEILAILIRKERVLAETLLPIKMALAILSTDYNKNLMRNGKTFSKN